LERSRRAAIGELRVRELRVERLVIESRGELAE